ncbi:TPA: OmpP1/FadL family transporter [Pseudomonas aeruginosa]|jgi:long-chain fatty acid transport protein|uniref:OmpP1/FadL family transporter n=1 Tax=Pseudomonas aeruginosa TaxID=287 RepID=UPI00053E0343|nr:outer membrane protein transport protein [Pseudomonas aeruginosa]
MQYSRLPHAIALTLAGFSSYSLANGLALNEQSVSGMGTAFAGRASSALDASTLYGNPAGMSKLKRTEVVGGAAYVKPKTDISDVNTSVSGTSKGDIAPGAAVPFGYVVTPLNEDFHFGLGFYVPFGVVSDNEKSFQGRAHGLYSKVQVTTLQPTISYRISDTLSVGFGPTLNKIDGKLTNRLDTSMLGGSGGTSLKIKGDDIAYGFNLGVLWDVTDQLALGLTYHSKVEYELEGHTKVANSPAGMLDGRFDTSLDITTPESIDASLTYRLNERWTTYAGITWTRWSRLDKIVAETSSAFLGDIDEQMGWHDTWSYAIGAAYQLNPQWVLRAGLALDQSPTSNAERNVRIPVGDRKIFSLGAGWSPTPDVTIDLAYSYLREESVNVNRAADTFKPAYSAQYQNSAHGIGTQLTYRF